VYINGEHIGKLNDYAINETQDYVPGTVSIPFDPVLLHPFDNTIEIIIQNCTGIVEEEIR